MRYGTRDPIEPIEEPIPQPAPDPPPEDPEPGSPGTVPP